MPGNQNKGENKRFLCKGDVIASYFQKKFNSRVVLKRKGKMSHRRRNLGLPAGEDGKSEIQGDIFDFLLCVTSLHICMFGITNPPSNTSELLGQEQS